MPFAVAGGPLGPADGAPLDVAIVDVGMAGRHAAVGAGAEGDEMVDMAISLVAPMVTTAASYHYYRDFPEEL